ncbi:uncharacterized protein TNIN_333941 [Trichonephila inaurata madagascariensis]|uniref:Uncharacterized protein n=1 Tax=Trichonephila inaurata madagascariensis TaxID=2747483 RepID=A0A8X6YME3_9ARAC|nr:uncharacterized protein TNIN_333941 [Trichonephila inaurata madagascariensis]
MNAIPPLERLALIRVAMSIYNASAFSKFRDTFLEVTGLTQIFPMRRLFRERISDSAIPNILREKLLDIFLPISREIDSWRKDMSDFGIHKQLDICLTSYGTIDRVETAKKFVRSDDPNLLQRFTLACLFWMTEDVLNIWNKASVYERIHIEMTLLSEKTKKDEYYRVHDVATNCLKKWLDWLHEGGDPYALHIFVNESFFNFPQVPPEANLVRALPPKKLRELIRSKFRTSYGRAYFSCLDYNQKMRFLQQEPFSVLEDYLRWPLQFYFLEMASQAWEYMAEADFTRLLRIISEEKTSPRIPYVDCESDFDYQGLLMEFWKQSPQRFKMFAEESHFCPRYGIIFRFI